MFSSKVTWKGFSEKTNCHHFKAGCAYDSTYLRSSFIDRILRFVLLLLRLTSLSCQQDPLQMSDREKEVGADVDEISRVVLRIVVDGLSSSEAVRSPHKKYEACTVSHQCCMEARRSQEGGLTAQNPFRLVQCRGPLLSCLWLCISKCHPQNPFWTSKWC